MRLPDLFWNLIAVVAVLLSLSFFWLIEQYYCPSADDFSGIQYASVGIPGISYASQFYMNWEGPYLSQLLMGLLMRLFIVTQSAALTLSIAKLALILTSALFVKSVSDRFNMGWTWAKALISAVLFVLSLYLVSPSQSEIWHWLIGSVYLLPLIYFLLAGSFIIQNRFYMACVPVAFLMQSRITYAVLLLFAIGIYTVILQLQKSDSRRGWLGLFLVGAISLVVYVVAPGNYVRLSEHGNTVAFMFSQFKLGLTNFFISFNLAKGDRVVLLLLSIVPVLLQKRNFPRPNESWQYLIPGLVYLTFIIGHAVLFVVLTGYCEWIRVLSFHSFLFLMVCVIYGGWMYGLIPVQWRGKTRFLSLVGVLVLLYKLQIGYQEELKMAHDLHLDYHQRMELIMNHQTMNDTLYLDKINYDGVLYFEDFSADPNHWINKDFVRAYGLKFNVAVTK